MADIRARIWVCF